MTAIYDLLSRPSPPAPAAQAATPYAVGGAQDPGAPHGAGDADADADEPDTEAVALPRAAAPALTRAARIAVVVDRVGTAEERVVEGLETGLRRHGVDLLVYAAAQDEDPDGAVAWRTLREARVSGLVSLTYPLLGAAGALDEATRRLGGLPTVVVGTVLPHVSSVACDNAASMAALAAHLLDEGGVRRPAFVRGVPTHADSKERERAFRAACSERGIAVASDRVVDGGGTRGRAHRAATALLTRDPGVDGVVAASDRMAEGVLDALADLGLDVPGQVKVAGFDGDVRSARTRPPLTTVDQRLYEQGQAAADLLAAQLDGDAQPRQALLEGRLVVRRSTRPYRARPARRLPRELVQPGREALLQAVQAEIGPCPPVVDATWARRWLERLREQLEAGLLDEAWVRSWGRPTGTVDDLERATTWLVGAARVVLDHAWRDLRGDDARFAAADVHGQVTARLVAVRAEGVRASDRAELGAVRDVLDLTRALAGAGSLTDVGAALVPHLPRLGVTDCFVLVFGPGTAEPVGAHAAGARESANLVLAYTDGAVQPTDGEAGVELERLMPGGEDGPALTVAPLTAPAGGGSAVEGEQYGLLLYRQEPGHAHAAEAVHAEIAARVAEVVSRRRLSSRADELSEVLAERTAQLQAEMDTRLRVEDELRRANRELTRSLLVDSLTGIHNRASLDEVLRREFEAHRHSRRPLAFLMVDVDHFKAYNDRYGHPQGDATLRLVADRLRDCARRGGDIAARYGGEEFALVLPDTDRAGAEKVAGCLLERVRTSAIEHADSPGRRLTVSAGVAVLVPGEDRSVEDLVRAADAALYRAKAEGRDRIAVAEGTDVTAPGPAPRAAPAVTAAPTLPGERALDAAAAPLPLPSR